MKIQISDTFTYKKLIKFTVPSILMMIITSVYVVVDGLFVSNYVGKEAFSSLNLIMPFIMVFGAFGFMLGTGGCALMAKYIGEGENKRANEVFSLIIYVLLIGAVVCTIFGIVFLEPISILLGATPELLEDCIIYGAILLLALPFFMLQTSFQIFVVVADRPNMGMALSVFSGVTNIVLDYLFIVVFEWGIAGAAWATASSQIVGAIIPLIYFASKKNKSNLKIVKFRWHFKDLLKSCTNGSSEMMTNVSLSLVNMLYNIQLMHFIGSNGVSAYGIIMYISFIFNGVFIGYTIGACPLISYNYGAKNHIELKSLFKKSLILITTVATVLTLIGVIFSREFAWIFVGYDKSLLDLSTKALSLYSISYLFSAINIFASALYTALNNGKISALLSFLRTLVFQAIMIMGLPYIFDIDGIWLAVVFAELMCLVLTIYFFKKANKRYNYY